MMLSDQQYDTYYDFIEKLDKEWPAERVKEHLLLCQRRRAKKCQQRIEELELKNRDDRRNGVSYAKRKETTRHIEIWKGLFAEAVRQGLKFKQEDHPIAKWVKPGDEDFINSRGLEAHLMCATM
jgi:hypothetical protein